jgi:hypothetical protein
MNKILCLLTAGAALTIPLTPVTIMDLLNDEERDRLREMRDQPLDINRSGSNALSQIPFLPLAAARRIVTGRRGRYYRSLDDLVKRDLLTRDRLNRCRPYLHVVPRQHKRRRAVTRTIARLRTDLLAGVPTGSLPLPTHAVPVTSYARVRFQYAEHWFGAVVIEKDRGETDWSDLVKANVRYSGTDIIHTAVLGGMKAAWGHGLVLATSFPPRFSTWSPTGRPAGRERLTNDTGKGEHYLRGAGLNVVLGPPEMRHSLSVVGGQYNYAGTEEPLDPGAVSSFFEEAVHDDDLSRGRKNNVREYLGALRYRLGNAQAHIGAAAAYHLFDHFVTASSSRRFYTFRGHHLANTGVTAHADYGPWQLGGAAAVALYPAYTPVGRAVVRQDKLTISAPSVLLHIVGEQDRHEYSARFRYLPANYFNPHAAVLRQTASDEEAGLTIGARTYPLKTLLLSGYSDFYLLPRGTYYDPRNDAGLETGARLRLRLAPFSLMVYQKIERRHSDGEGAWGLFHDATSGAGISLKRKTVSVWLGSKLTYEAAAGNWPSAWLNGARIGYSPQPWLGIRWGSYLLDMDTNLSRVFSLYAGSTPGRRENIYLSGSGWGHFLRLRVGPKTQAVYVHGQLSLPFDDEPAAEVHLAWHGDWRLKDQIKE